MCQNRSDLKMYSDLYLKSCESSQRGEKKKKKHTWSQNCLNRTFLDFKPLVNKYANISWHGTDYVKCGDNVVGSCRVGIQEQSGWQNACLWARCTRCHAHRRSQDLEEPRTSFKGLQRRIKKNPSLSFSLFKFMVVF